MYGAAKLWKLFTVELVFASQVFDHVDCHKPQPARCPCSAPSPETLRVLDVIEPLSVENAVGLRSKAAELFEHESQSRYGTPLAQHPVVLSDWIVTR